MFDIVQCCVGTQAPELYARMHLHLLLTLYACWKPYILKPDQNSHAGVPKTRSGKIMRRILRKIASKQESEIGDTSTLADPSVVDQLLKTRGK